MYDSREDKTLVSMMDLALDLKLGTPSDSKMDLKLDFWLGLQMESSSDLKLGLRLDQV